jgi:malonate-semialdehyde dehydrogenase (acetylating)/methylmalonate-semialdehyde dehydrogenase
MNASLTPNETTVEGQAADRRRVGRVQTTEWHDIVNPATQQVLAKVPFATADEVDAAISAAHRAFQTWKLTPIGARMRIMLKLQALIREHSKRIAVVLSAEQGKTIADAEGDIFRGLEVVEHACSIGTLQMGEFAENVAGGVDTYTLRQPIGVCAGITPFNFPAMIPLWMFPMAIACGNTFVLKPSEQDPLSTMLLVELALEAGVPAGVLNVVHGGKEVVDGLHPQGHQGVSFVGSTAVGTHVYNLAGKHGKRVQSMMGAKNHAVVLPDANREQALNALVGAGFGAAGQRCMATSVVVLVGGAAMAAGPESAGAEAQGQRRQRAGHRRRPGDLQARQGADSELIESGIKEGAKLELDGRDVKVPGYEQGNFVGPTLFSGVTTDMQIYTQEIFGPVLVVLEVDTLDRPSRWSTPTRSATAPACSPRAGGGAQVPERNRRRPGRHQHPDPGAGAVLQLHRLARLQARRPRPVRQASGAVLHPDQTVTARWFDDDSVNDGVNTTINLR